MTPDGEMNLGIDYAIESYLHHQGAKWVSQYDPNSMLYISKAIHHAMCVCSCVCVRVSVSLCACA